MTPRTIAINVQIIKRKNVNVIVTFAKYAKNRIAKKTWIQIVLTKLTKYIG